MIYNCARSQNTARNWKNHVAAVSLAIVAASIAWDVLHLLQRGGYQQIKKRIIAALGWRSGEVRGTAIVSGEVTTLSQHALLRTNSLWLRSATA